MRNQGLVFALVSGLLFGCGPNSNTVTLTIDPNIGPHHLHNLSTEFFANGRTHAATCLQPNLSVGVKLGGDEDDNSNISTYPVKMQMDVCGTAPCSGFDIFSWLDSHSALVAPIQVTIPKSTIAEVGIVGNLVTAADNILIAGGAVLNASDGICDIYTAPDVASTNYSVIGHRFVPTLADKTIQLNSWVLSANSTHYTIPTDNGDGTWNARDFYCPNRDDKEQCSYRDLVQVNVQSSSVIKLFSVEYFFGKNTGSGVKHYLYNSSFQTGFFIPSTFPMKVTFSTGGSTQTYDIPKSGKYFPISGDSTNYISFQELGNTQNL